MAAIHKSAVQHLKAAFLALVAVLATTGYAGNITTFSLPGYGLQPTLINASGTVAGLAFGSGNVQLFIRNSKGDIEVFQPENSTGLATSVLGMNDKGDIVGTYLDNSTGTYKGFLRSSKGSVSTYSVPGSSFITIQTAINNAGAITGAYINASGEAFAFVRQGNKLDIFQALVGNAGAVNVQTIPLYINVKGQVSGRVVYEAPEPVPGTNYVNYVTHVETFIRNADGSIVLLQLPEQYLLENYLVADLQITPTGMNANGEVSGYYHYGLFEFDGSNTTRVADIQKGFVADSSGAMLDIAPPDAFYVNPSNLLEIQAQASGINGAGKVAGYYWDRALNANIGFVFTGKGSEGSFDTFDLSNYGPAVITGINNGGKVIGSYYDPETVVLHGFIAN